MLGLVREKLVLGEVEGALGGRRRAALEGEEFGTGGEGFSFGREVGSGRGEKRFGTGELILRGKIDFFSF